MNTEHDDWFWEDVDPALHTKQPSTGWDLYWDIRPEDWMSRRVLVLLILLSIVLSAFAWNFVLMENELLSFFGWIVVGVSGLSAMVNAYVLSVNWEALP